MAVSVGWQHCIDHADKQTNAAKSVQTSSRRSSAADRQSVKGQKTQRFRVIYLIEFIQSNNFHIYSIS